MYNRSCEVSEKVDQFKSKNNKVLRNVWKGDMFSSETRLRNYVSSEQESFSPVEPLKLRLDSTPRRATRSSVKPLDLSFVQSKVLEYKLKSKKK